MERERFIQVFSDFLKKRGYDVDNDPNYAETPLRVYRVYNELVVSREEAIKSAKGVLSKTFPYLVGSGVNVNNLQPSESVPGILLVKDIEVTTLCPHHLLPVFMRVGFAYIPQERVVGLSKVVRFLKELGKGLWLQEEYTHVAADVFMEEVKCAGCMVVVRAVHGCMRYRGVREGNEIVTSVIRGVFCDIDVKEEVIKLGI